MPIGGGEAAESPAVFERIADGHLAGGRAVEEYALACNPMTETDRR
jgi:(2Fe-2S) ferredoxin